MIIPFPSPRPSPPEEPAARLQRALASLNAALAEQREIVASWRAAIADLDSGVTNLGESLQRYRDTLGHDAGAPPG